MGGKFGSLTNYWTGWPRTSRERRLMSYHVDPGDPGYSMTHQTKDQSSSLHLNTLRYAPYFLWPDWAIFFFFNSGIVNLHPTLQFGLWGLLFRQTFLGCTFYIETTTLNKILNWSNEVFHTLGWSRSYSLLRFMILQPSQPFDCFTNLFLQNQIIQARYLYRRLLFGVFILIFIVGFTEI